MEKSTSSGIKIKVHLSNWDEWRRKPLTFEKRGNAFSIMYYNMNVNVQ
jgi:hypothetical protein